MSSVGVKTAEISPADIEEQKLYRSLGLSDDEYQLIKNEILRRLPNYTEVGLFSGMWSEHCSYKNSKPVLKNSLPLDLVL